MELKHYTWLLWFIIIKKSKIKIYICIFEVLLYNCQSNITSVFSGFIIFTF